MTFENTTWSAMIEQLRLKVMLRNRNTNSTDLQIVSPENSLIDTKSMSQCKLDHYVKRKKKIMLFVFSHLLPGNFRKIIFLQAKLTPKNKKQ